MMRFLTILGCFLVLCFSGCTSIRRGEPAACAQNSCGEPVEVIMVHGLGGYWPGAYQQAARLQEEGFQTTQIIGMPHAELKVREMIRDYESGERRRPVVLVGYSIGANWVNWMAEELDCAGYPVHSMVLLDPSYEVDVPCNVQHCLNLYTARPATDWVPFFRGQPVTTSCGNTYNCELQSTFPGKFPNTHFSICANDLMHRVIAKHLAQRVHGRCCAESCSKMEETKFTKSAVKPDFHQSYAKEIPASQSGIRQASKEHLVR